LEGQQANERRLTGPLTKVWRDPVWSKVIAAAIVSITVLAGTLCRQYMEAILPDSHLDILVGFGSASQLLMLGALFYVFTVRLRVNMIITLDHFQQAPILAITVRNLSWQATYLSAIEFLTKEQWDIPDVQRHGFVVPIIGHLQKSDVRTLINISSKKGSQISKTVAQSLGARASETIYVRLTTDHSPYYSFGLFLFLLGVDLVYGESARRLTLPDILVSLHGQIAMSETIVQGNLLPFVSLGQLQTLGNIALSKIDQGALCAPQLKDILRETLAEAEGRVL
jgi:hypothetical protein